jgi:PadR family transcriptional regulator, regulatory protein PadR
MGPNQMRRGTTTVILLQLLAEVERPMHGYEIIKELEMRSQGLFGFKEGLIYPKLHDMERSGLLAAQWEGEEGTRRRRRYEITDEGRRRLTQEMADWRAFRSAMDSLLGIASTGEAE